MATVLTLREDLNTYVADLLEPAAVFRLFNAVLRDIAGSARIPTKQMFSVAGDEMIVNLAADLVEIKEIRVQIGVGTSADIGSLYSAYGMVNLDNVAIEWEKPLPLPSIITVRGYRIPKEIIGDSDTPEIPPQFHNLLSYGAAIKYLVADEELASADRWKMEYVPLLNKLEDFTKNRGSSSVPMQSNITPIWARR